MRKSNDTFFSKEHLRVLRDVIKTYTCLDLEDNSPP